MSYAFIELENLMKPIKFRYTDIGHCVDRKCCSWM